MTLAFALHAKRAAAILAATLPLLIIIAAACATPEPQVIEREIIVKEVEVEVVKVVTATPAPQPTSTPVPTATPKPAPTATSAPARAETRNAAANPTSTPKPSATPTLTVDDFYVIINQGPTSNGKGIVALYNLPQLIESGNGLESHFENEDFFINHLLSQGVITPAQRTAYYTPVSVERENFYYDNRMAEFFDEKDAGNIKIPLQQFANAMYKLQHLSPKKETLHEETISYFIRTYVDENSLDSDMPVPSDDTLLAPSKDEGYVIINGNNVQTVMVDDQGNTTSVDVKITGIEEVLDYWLSQNKITVEQRDQYGRTGQLELSFKDGADLFDFAYSDGAFHAGIDEEGASIIRDKLLPLFTGE